MSNFRVERVDGQHWHSKYAKEAYAKCLGLDRPNSNSAPDFVLLAFKDDFLIGFVECFEIDAFTVGWRFGGALIDVQKTRAVVPCAILLYDWCLERFFKIRTYVGSDFKPAIRLLRTLGFESLSTRRQGTVSVIELECVRPGISLDRIDAGSFARSISMN